MPRNYVFIGGPLDMETRTTQDDYWIDCIEYDKSLNASSFLDEGCSPATSFTTHRYSLKSFNIMGTIRKFYVSEKISQQEADKKIGLFIASLIDLYANA